MAALGDYYAYILGCSDGNYYVGSTEDLRGRLVLHIAGQGPRYTAARLPVVLIHKERFDTMAQAREREVQIKKWSRAKKEALIKGDLVELKRLSKRRT